MNAIFVGMNSMINIHHLGRLLKWFVFVSVGTNFFLFSVDFLTHGSHHVSQERAQVVVQFDRTYFKHFLAFAEKLFAWDCYSKFIISLERQNTCNIFNSLFLNQTLPLSSFSAGFFRIKVKLFQFKVVTGSQVVQIVGNSSSHDASSLMHTIVYFLLLKLLDFLVPL